MRPTLSGIFTIVLGSLSLLYAIFRFLESMFSQLGENHKDEIVLSVVVGFVLLAIGLILSRPVK